MPSADITVIIPIRNNPSGPEVLLRALLPVLEDGKISPRVLFVDDGSSDGGRTIAALEKAARMEEGVGWISLRRNMGQQRALFHGFREALKKRGAAANHYLLTMDDDLAHPPEYIPRLLEEIFRGKELVYGIFRKNRLQGQRPLYAIGGILRDVFFRALLRIPRGVRVGSFRLLTSGLAEKITAEEPPFVYISALAFRHTRRAGCVIFSDTKKRSRAGTSRYSFFHRAAVLLKLIVCYGPVIGPLVTRIVPGPRDQQGQRGSMRVIKERGGWAEEKTLKLHIMGAGHCQISAIKRARAMGIPTVVSDREPDAPGLPFADEISRASTFDSRGVTLDARRFGSTAFLSTGTDQPVLTAALAARALGAPYFLDPSRARLVTNKREMKRAFLRLGVPTSPFLFMDEQTDPGMLSSLIPPLVIKPLDSQGQRGVYRVESPEEAVGYLPRVLSFSREREALVEEYYPSREVTVSGWVEKGEYVHLTITDRVTRDNLPHIGVCLAHHYPSVFQEREEEIVNLTKKIVRGFGLTKGPIYFQYLIGERGIRVNETACRLGGAYEDIFIPWITGVDILDVMIRMSCGMPYPAPRKEEIFRRRKKRFVSLQMFYCDPGILRRQSGMEDVSRMPGILGGDFLLTPGTEIKNRENSTQRAGYFIVSGESIPRVNRRTEKAFRRLSMRDTRGRELLFGPPVLLPYSGGRTR